jgi:hypothetical protein
VKLDEAHLQYSLWARRSSGLCLAVPNFTPRTWYECDLATVTNSGYFHEFEIKLSLSDLRKDKVKGGKTPPVGTQGWVGSVPFLVCVSSGYCG